MHFISDLLNGQGSVLKQYFYFHYIEHKKEGEPLPEDDPLTKLTVTTVSEEGKLFELGGKSKGWIESVVTLNGVVQERTDGK